MPSGSIPVNACGAAAARTASTATWTFAVGAVLEADRHRQARAELAVDLALGRAGADRSPGDGVGDVLRRDRVEELAADRQPEVQHLEQQLAGHAQAGVDVAGVVEVGIVDQALPAGRRPRLLEVDAHHDEQVVAQLVRRSRERGARTRRRPRRRGRCTGPTTTSSRSSSPSQDRCRPRRGPAAPRSALGRGERELGRAGRPGRASGSIRSIRRSRMRSTSAMSRRSWLVPYRRQPRARRISLPAISATRRTSLGVVGERGRRQRLRAVADRLLGLVVDLDDDPVGARRRRRQRHRLDPVAPARARGSGRR